MTFNDFLNKENNINEAIDIKKINTLSEGDSFIDQDGGKIKILTIALTDIHRNPDVLIQYEYEFEDKKGKETNRLSSFIKNFVK